MKDFNLEQKDHVSDYYVGFYKTFGKTIEDLLVRVKQLELTNAKYDKKIRKMVIEVNKLTEIINDMECGGVKPGETINVSPEMGLKKVGR